MPNSFSRYCFRQQFLEETLSHLTIKAKFNGCEALFGEPACAKLLNWTDGENAANIQVSILPILYFYTTNFITQSLLSVWLDMVANFHWSNWCIDQSPSMMGYLNNITQQ